MQLQPVNSSAIAAVGYKNGTLAVQFHNNPETYKLPNVPYDLFVEFIRDSSRGKFWNRHLHGKFK